MVHVAREPARAAEYREPATPLGAHIERALTARGVGRLYTHQAEAWDLAASRRDLLMATGTASGKSLAYIMPILECLGRDGRGTHLIIFPTKALCQDQMNALGAAMEAAGLDHALAGVYDGDTPASLRRKLRDHASVILTNPDMLHAGIMPGHGRWSGFLGNLATVVVDEMHVYSGVFGANMSNLMRRLARLCGHYGSKPLLVGCTATTGDPEYLGRAVSGRPMEIVSRDGSPRGARVTVLWNPPRARHTVWRSRRSANVEAHEVMALLMRLGAPTITFSKAKMTAELIARYVAELLGRSAPHLASMVTAYRGGYLPEERRAIEQRLFRGELLGVSTTPALELGIDVGGLDAAIIVGYPGTLASYHQQAGRAGRRDREALVILIGLDTPANQYIMRHPEYVLGRAIEKPTVDGDNPFVVLGHIRCAAHELPVRAEELPTFGPNAELAANVLEANRKLTRTGDTWYHSAPETPQHETPMRGFSDGNVMIEDAATGAIIGELNRYDAQPIIHPEAIYIHQGDTYRVLELDLERNRARAQREQTDYYTQPLGGTDVHHVDHTLRSKRFGAGRACWGEVTSRFQTFAYEKIRFYTLDAISMHGLDLPALLLDTAALWVIPPEAHMKAVRDAGLDPHNGLRGIGYATRMALPLFVTCDTADFSHSVGSANTPWQTLFVYERYPCGLGFTESAYGRLHEIMPAVRDMIRSCDCVHGCPCCVGKPLRQFTTWNVERGEGSIPSKAAALMVLDLLLGDGEHLDEPDDEPADVAPEARRARLEQELRRRLEVMRSPRAHHPIAPSAPVGPPLPEPDAALGVADPAMRRERRLELSRQMRRRLAELQAPRADAPPEQAATAEGARSAPTAAVTIGSPVAARAIARLRERRAQQASGTEESHDERD